MKRGELRWYTFRLPDKRRPVLILTRDDIIDHLNEIIVVPQRARFAPLRQCDVIEIQRAGDRHSVIPG